jgi:voltage-gated potassium channel
MNLVSFLKIFWEQVERRMSLLLEWLVKHIFTTIISAMIMVLSIIGALVAYVETGSEGANVTGFYDALWWGIVTLLTVGYGDRFPVTPVGRFLAVGLMIAGVTAVGILTARVSSIFLEKALNDRRGVVDQRTLSDHFIICGWKEQMYDFLCHVLDANPKISAKDIVLVNNNSDDVIRDLLENKNLDGIKVVKGDFFLEVTLKKAAPQRAKKILILADATPTHQGHVPTVVEADARTVMTAMTLSSIAKGVPVIAEVLDEKMDKYLRLAHVNEIIYSRNYSRLLMAKASQGTGITNIIHDLLNPKGSHRLVTVPIPEDCYEKSYAHLKEKMCEKHPEMVILGILENSGNSQAVKESALRKAQMTPDIEQLVSNLHAIRNLRFNEPVFAPNKDHIVTEGSLAIVVEATQVRGQRYGQAA